MTPAWGDGVVIMSETCLTDTYVICCTKRPNVWTAHSIKTNRISTGNSAQEALGNAIQLVDRILQRIPADERAGAFSPAPDLILELAKRAEPLTDTTDCVPGVIYKFVRPGPNADAPHA